MHAKYRLGWIIIFLMFLDIDDCIFFGFGVELLTHVLMEKVATIFHFFSWVYNVAIRNKFYLMCRTKM